jgi:hypothetical protein
MELTSLLLEQESGQNTRSLPLAETDQIWPWAGKTRQSKIAFSALETREKREHNRAMIEHQFGRT